MSTGLRLVALANGRYHSVRSGDTAYDDHAAQIVHLALKARKSGVEDNLNPIRLLPTHLYAPDVTPTETARLDELAEHLGAAAVATLCRARTPALAKDLCRLFRLGRDGMRAWEKQRKKTKKGGTHKKKGSTKSSLPSSPPQRQSRSRRAEAQAARRLSRFGVEASKDAELALQSDFDDVCDAAMDFYCSTDAAETFQPPAALDTPPLRCDSLNITLMATLHPETAAVRQNKVPLPPPPRGLAKALLPAAVSQITMLNT